MNAKVKVQRVAVAYLAASVAAALVGRSLSATLAAIGDFAELAILLLLGPLFSLATAFPGAERTHPTLPSVWMFAIFWYVICTALLALCLALILREGRVARVVGYSLAVVIWISSVGLPMLGGMLE